jgi:hypothetical protein
MPSCASSAALAVAFASASANSAQFLLLVLTLSHHFSVIVLSPVIQLSVNYFINFCIMHSYKPVLPLLNFHKRVTLDRAAIIPPP